MKYLLLTRKIKTFLLLMKINFVNQKMLVLSYKMISKKLMRRLEFFYFYFSPFFFLCQKFIKFNFPFHRFPNLRNNKKRQKLNLKMLTENSQVNQLNIKKSSEKKNKLFNPLNHLNQYFHFSKTFLFSFSFLSFFFSLFFFIDRKWSKRGFFERKSIRKTKVFLLFLLFFWKLINKLKIRIPMKPPVEKKPVLFFFIAINFNFFFFF